jgi:hypothetical protein
MGYVFVKTEPKASPYGLPFHIWSCYFCKALMVTRERYEKPPAKCGMCKR